MVRQTVKQMLIDLYREEREQERCSLVHELKKEAEKIAKPYSINIGKMEVEIFEINSRISDIRLTMRKEVEKRDKSLRDAKLYHFEIKVCGDALHSNLLAFDKETHDHIRSILEGK